MGKISSWYKGLSGTKKVIAHFFIQWLYWLLATKIMDLVWPDDKPKTTKELLFHTTFMALFMTLCFQWKTVKLIFRKNESK